MAETVGLDIGSHSIKLVGLENTSKGPFLTCFGLKRIPQSIDKEDINSLSILLKDLIDETGIKTKKVRLTISGAGTHIRRMTLPSIPKNELTQTLPWEMKDHLPFPVETARIQYHILGEFVEDGAKKLDLLTVACPMSLINRTLSIASGAGLQVTHLDVNAFALWNMLHVRDQLKIGETVALIDLGSEKMSLFLFKDGILQFNREMTPAGADLTRAIMDGIPFEQDLGFRYEKAEKIKEEVGILANIQEGRVAGEKLNLSKLSFLMRPVLERCVAEIGRSLDYYRNQFYGEKIDRILLAGGGAHLKNIASYLEGELHLPVGLFNPLKEMIFDAKRVNGEALEEAGSMFTTAVGIALSRPKQIEFLPVKEPFLTRILLEKAIMILAPLFTALLFLGMIWHKTVQVTHLQEERNDKVARAAKLEDIRGKLSILKEKESKIKQDLSLFPSSVTPPLPYRKALKEVNEVIPGNMTLTFLEIQPGAKQAGKPPQVPASKETGPPGHQKRTLHLSGLAFGNDIHCLTALAKIIEGLERSPLFSHVKLVSTEENKLYNQLATEFDIVCDINPISPSQSEEKGKKEKP